jgi:hypothetical protein
MDETNFDNPELVVTDNMRNLESKVRALIRWLENISVDELAQQHNELDTKVATISSVLATIGRNDLTTELSALLENTFSKLTQLKEAQASEQVNQPAMEHSSENRSEIEPTGGEQLIANWSALSIRITDCFRGHPIMQWQHS